MKQFIAWMLYAFFVALIVDLIIYRKDVKTYIKGCKERWKELKRLKKALKKQKPLKKVKRKKIRNISAVKT